MQDCSKILWRKDSCMKTSSNLAVGVELSNLKDDEKTAWNG